MELYSTLNPYNAHSFYAFNIALNTIDFAHFMIGK